MHPFERFNHVKTTAREADLTLYRRLIGHCHAWSDAEASQVLALQQRLALSDAAIESDISQHLTDSSQCAAAKQRVEQYRDLTVKRTQLQRAAAFDGIPDATRWTTYESLLAKLCTDPDAAIPFDREEPIAEYLSSRDYTKDASGAWMKDGLPYERDIAVNMEFVMDYEAVSDACQAWLAVPPTGAAPEEVSEEMLTAIEAEVDALNHGEDSFPLAEVLVAGYQAYCDPSADSAAAKRCIADRIQTDRAELNTHITNKRNRPVTVEMV